MTLTTLTRVVGQASLLTSLPVTAFGHLRTTGQQKRALMLVRLPSPAADGRPAWSLFRLATAVWAKSALISVHLPYSACGKPALPWRHLPKVVRARQAWCLASFDST